MQKALDYKDISLVPRVASTLRSRREANTGIDCFGIHLDIPIIASPMPDVCDGKMASQLAMLGSIGIIHRFLSIQDEVKEFNIARQIIYDEYDTTDISYAKNIACAIGATGDYQDRFKALYEAGCRIFCVDTANGFNEQVAEAIKWLLGYEDWTESERIYIIAGNVASAEGYRYLAELGVDAIRVGIAGGSVCETKTETGVWMPMVTAIQETVNARADYAHEIVSKLVSSEYETFANESETAVPSFEEFVLNHPSYQITYNNLPLIIADGGIKTPADLCKILAVGADLAFCGSIFAGTDEAPGNVINDNGRLLKLYRGAASFGVQAEYSDKEPDYVEGRESFVSYKGKVSKVIKRFKGGLASSMSYMNARTIEEFRNNVSIIVV